MMIAILPSSVLLLRPLLLVVEAREHPQSIMHRPRWVAPDVETVGHLLPHRMRDIRCGLEQSFSRGPTTTTLRSINHTHYRLTGQKFLCVGCSTILFLSINPLKELRLFCLVLSCPIRSLESEPFERWSVLTAPQHVHMFECAAQDARDDRSWMVGSRKRRCSVEGANETGHVEFLNQCLLEAKSLRNRDAVVLVTMSSEMGICRHPCLTRCPQRISCLGAERKMDCATSR